MQFTTTDDTAQCAGTCHGINSGTRRSQRNASGARHALAELQFGFTVNHDGSRSYTKIGIVRNLQDTRLDIGSTLIVICSAKNQGTRSSLVQRTGSGQLAGECVDAIIKNINRAIGIGEFDATRGIKTFIQTQGRITDDNAVADILAKVRIFKNRQRTAINFGIAGIGVDAGQGKCAGTCLGKVASVDHTRNRIVMSIRINCCPGAVKRQIMRHDEIITKLQRRILDIQMARGISQIAIVADLQGASIHMQIAGERIVTAQNKRSRARLVELPGAINDTCNRIVVSACIDGTARGANRITSRR